MQILPRTPSSKKGKPAQQISNKEAAKSKIAAKDAAKAEKRGSRERVKAIISAETRQRLIAETAYYYAEQRGFEGGDPMRDWLRAEAQIDSMYQQKR